MKKKINRKLPGFYDGLDWFNPSVVSNNPLMRDMANDINNLYSPITPMAYDPKNDLKILGQLGKIPKGGIMSKIGNGANFASGAISFAGDIMNAFGRVKSTNELLADSGTSNSNVGGFGYTVQNDIDQAA
jgi:hypothetical protein